MLQKVHEPSDNIPRLGKLQGAKLRHYSYTCAK